LLGEREGTTATEEEVEGEAWRSHGQSWDKHRVGGKRGRASTGEGSEGGAKETARQTVLGMEGMRATEGEEARVGDGHEECSGRACQRDDGALGEEVT